MIQQLTVQLQQQDGWSALHYGAKNGHLDVTKQLIESGASSKVESNNGKIPLCYAVASEHFDVIEYLLRKDHDSYALLTDKKFVSDLTMVSKKYKNKPLQDFVLLSPAPVETAAKLSHILLHLSAKEKEKTRDLMAASRYCESMATDILSLAAGSKSAGMLLRALDFEQTEFLDILIQLEQKEVIAHPAVQRYLNEVWIGQMEWSNYRTVTGILLFLICPPIWMYFSLPLGHKYIKVPVIKFISQVVSHFYFIILLILTVVTPLWPIWTSTNLVPHVPEWMVMIWLAGMVLSELTNPGERTGLGILRIISLVSGCMSIGAHLIGFAFTSEYDRQDVLYVRNQLLAVSMLFACVQLLDFLTFHHLFGPWTVIIKALMVDLGRFLVIMSIFVLGFSLHVAAIYQPVRPTFVNNGTDIGFGYPPNEAPVQSPLQTLEMMFFSIFGLIDTYDYLPPLNSHPLWSQTLIKIVFGTYMIVAVIVLINLLIAMMSDTYQRIQAKSDTEWKFGLAKLIRNTNRTSSAPAPLNLFTKLIICVHAFIVYRGRLCDSGALEYMKTERLPKDGKRLDVTTNVGGNWISKLRNKSIGPGLTLPTLGRGSSSASDLIMDISRTQSSSASAATGARKLENVIDWSKVVHKYLSSTGHGSLLEKDNEDGDSRDGEDSSDRTSNGQV